MSVAKQCLTFSVGDRLRRFGLEKLQNLRLIVTRNYVVSVTQLQFGMEEVVFTDAAIVPIHNERSLQK